MPPKELSDKAEGSPSKPKSTPTNTKATPTKEKAEKLIPALTDTETKLLVFATHYHEKKSAIDWDELAAQAGIMASSAKTLYRSGRRKIDRIYEPSAGDSTGAGVKKTPIKTGARKPKAKKKATPPPVTTVTDDEMEHDSDADNDEDSKPLPGEPDEESMNKMLDTPIKMESNDESMNKMLDTPVKVESDDAPLTEEA